MQDISLDTSELDELLQKLEQAPEVFQQVRREAFEAAAPELRQALDERIVSTIGDSRGKVRSWQDQFVGSKGGYAAVRPKKDTFTEPTPGGHTYAVGYVTNAINSGHRFPGQGGRKTSKAGKTEKYASGRVQGKYFYEKAQKSVEAIAKETCNQIVNDLIKHLEG